MRLVPSHHHGFAVLSWGFILSPDCTGNYTVTGQIQIPAMSVLSPMTQTHNRSEMQMEKTECVTFHFEKLFYFHILVVQTFVCLDLGFYTYFWPGFSCISWRVLVNRNRWFSFEVSKWAKDSLTQTGAEIIYSLVFVQHNSRRPWLECLVSPETEKKWSKIRDFWTAVYIVSKISSREGQKKKDTATENKDCSNLSMR